MKIPTRLLRHRGKPPARAMALAVCTLSLAALASEPGSSATLRQRVVHVQLRDANDISFRQLQGTVGPSQTRVEQIVQDNLGFLWFGTPHGLRRYDGYSQKSFTPDTETDPAHNLQGMYIRALFKDRTGTMWVASDQFLDRYDPDLESFTHIKLTDNGPDGSTITHIAQDRAGMLWFSTDQGLHVLDPSTGHAARLGHDPAVAASLGSNVIKSTMEDSAGTLWVATEEGLDAFDRATGQVTLHVPLRESREMRLLEARSGTLWIYHASGDGLHSYDRRSHTLTRYEFTDRDAAPYQVGIYAALEDHNGTLWFGTGGNGLLKFDPARGAFTRYRNVPNDTRSLSGDNVVALFEDREQNIWVALHGLPLNVFSARSPAFTKIPNRPSEPFGGGGVMVNSLFEDQHGILWVSYLGALLGLDRTSGAQLRFHGGAARLAADVSTMIEDKAGQLWAGTIGGGLSVLDPRKQRITTYLHRAGDPASLSHDTVLRLMNGPDGKIWVATWDGLDLLDPATGRFTTYRAPDQSGAAMYLDIKDDPNGGIWLGTNSSGLLHFDPVAGEFTSYARRAGAPDSLSNNRVNSVFVDHSGLVWAGTQNGLNSLDPSTGKISTYSTADGLPGSVVSCILEDARGNLWMSTNNGIARLDAQRTRFTSYSVADGLPGADLTGWGSCSQSRSGEMFFGGFSGATAFHPERVTDSRYIPPVVLTELAISGELVRVAPAAALTRALPFSEQITLPPDRNNFEIAFSALSFSSPETNRYRYRLVGVDRDWITAGADARRARYTTLPAGSYVFEAQAATGHGPWSEPGATIRIRVLPPWWATWTFRSLVGVAVLLIILATYFIRRRHLNRQLNMRIEERVTERTRIARELHDSLLQGFQAFVIRLQAVRNRLPGSPAEAVVILDSALGRADDALAEARTAILDLRTSSPRSSDLAECLKAIWDDLRMELRGDHPPSFCVVAEGRPRDLDPLIRDEVCRIAREALRNALHHAHASRLEAELAYGSDEFSLRIRDDGVGMADQVAQHGARSGHWGLQGMRERAQNVGGQLQVWSGSGAGTEVQIAVPARAAYGRGAVRAKASPPDGVSWSFRDR